MSEGEAGSYHLDHVRSATEQIRSIAATARQAGKLQQFTDILKKAVHLLRTDPHGWGDPEYRSASVDGAVCHAILRPVVFRYVIYEQVRRAVLLSVQVYTDFIDHPS